MIDRERQERERAKIVQEVVALSKEHKHLVVNLPTGCHEINHPILMYDGQIKKVQNIEVGDQIMGDDSTPRNVLSLARGRQRMYKIIPKKGESFIVNEDHILALKRTTVRKKDQRWCPEFMNITVKDYIKLPKFTKHLMKLYKTGVNFDKVNNEVEDLDLIYYLGLWLGDGYCKGTNISNVDIEIIDFLEKLSKKYDLKLKKADYRHYNLTGNQTGGIVKNKILEFLRKYNLIDNKHIPERFLFGTREERLSLLAGIIDSDGYLDRSTYEVCQIRKDLLYQIQFLSRSLGYYAGIKYKPSKCTNCEDKGERSAWRLLIGGAMEEIPCKIERKRINKLKQIIDYKKTGFTLQELDIDNYYGFELDGNHLYLDGYFFVHHNTGKGLAVAECIKASESDKKWLVLVPEIHQINNYRLDLIKHGNEDLLESKIEDIICYASLPKYQYGEYNFHLNECHRLSDFRLSVMSTMTFDQIISDSATINDEIEQRLYEIEPFYKYSKSLQEVIDLGILPQPEIVCVGVEMNDKQKKEYNKISNSINYWKDRWEREGREWARIRWLSTGNKRKTWMSNIKTEKAKELIQTFGNERFIVFTGSIDQAIELGGERAIHSKNKNSKQVIEDFNNETINSLFSCKMNIEGFNYNYLNKGLIVQIDGVDRTTLQKLGRLLRGDNPILYITYLKNTQDEKYLKGVIKEMDKEHIKFV